MPGMPHRGERPLQDVRAAMIAQLQGCSGRAAASLRLRVACTLDPQALWHLRLQLMQALAPERGEVWARAAIAEVDAVFLRHWPDSPVSRPAPLH